MKSHTSRERVFRALHDIAVAVGGVLEPVELARLVADRTCELFEVGAVGVYVLDDTGRVLTPVYSSDARASSPEPAIAWGSGAAGQAVALGEPVMVYDYLTWPDAGVWALANGVRSAMAVPLQVADHRTGALSVRTYAPRQWTDDDVQTLTLLAAQIAPALEAARLYERTRAAQLQAEAAIKLRDEVLAGVSHDLAGPLARIRLYAELIETESANVEPLATAEQLHAWSQRIIAATNTMKVLMQELLDVARVQMGQALMLDLRQTDLVTLAQRLAGELQAAGQRVTLRSSLDELDGWWDEARLSRVLSNLLENALNYSPAGTGVDILIDEVLETGFEMALVRVRDRGRGIPAEDLPRVFERFYRGSNVGEKTTGSGLGLAVARQIVEQHGGTIGIESRPGGGTIVSLRLPRKGPSERLANDLH
jgi:signal transduction histidine kinase